MSYWHPAFLLTFCLVWSQTLILLISAGITGVCHHTYLVLGFFFVETGSHYLYQDWHQTRDPLLGGNSWSFDGVGPRDIRCK
jgi:hypothetical protein